MNALVLGASGMAGHVVTLYLRENRFTVDTLSAHQKLDNGTQLVDVRDINIFKKFLGEKRYDVVINCIGLLVKDSEKQKELAVYLNAYLPRFLEAYYNSSQTKVIHISTDGVFSPDTAPHNEDSVYDGESFYGRTKALGELLNSKDLTFRMSIIGPDLRADGPSLFNWFYSQKGEITGYTNAIWNGVTTLELAKAIKSACEQNIVGLYHLVPAESISKFDLLQLLKSTFKRNDIKINPASGKVTDNTLVNTREDFVYTVPDYGVMINEMKVWIKNHPKLYKHYEIE